MAYFTEANVTVAITRKEALDNGLTEIWGTATFGNSSIQYATGGVPCSIGKLGFGKHANSIDIQSCSTNYIVNYDLTNSKFYMTYCDYNATSDGVPIEVPDTTALAATIVGYHGIGY